ncbi:outer membrane beta-barrel protein [Rufibacter tibetensis]|uniref:Outer membrane protein beta-barrel domain-containing protein n=1 Tax=Rufibacter tibetensis TaxID=512763 RepID=A0A0P0CJ74_9BACT|nr:outer membrane beta-barrel protein [Rufibacter tibetensis]ALI99442.1 hypothetical protein DC20_11280 [Rufibacter tibetensis]
MKESPAEHEQGQSVEDVFRNGFAGAESAPPSRIWENIDRELENHELHRYKKQVMWYRSLAAAFLLLLLSGGIILWKQSPHSGGGQLSQVTSQQKSQSIDAPAESDQLEESKSLAPHSRREEIANTAATGKEKLAAVSEAISAKQPQNRNHQSFPTSQGRGTALTKIESSAKEVAPSQSIDELQKQQEVIAGIQPERNSNPVPEEKTPTSSLFKINLSDKSFSKTLANSLSSSMEMPVGMDSLPSTSKRTILAPKEAEVTTLAQTPPAGKGPEKENADMSKWSVTMAYTPQYSYAPVKLGNNSSMGNAASLNQPPVYQQYQEAVDEYNNSYSPTYSYSTMVGASYKINEKWQLESGVLYTQNEATTTQSYIVYGGSNRSAFYSPGNMSNTYSDANKSTPLVTNALGREGLNQPIYVTRTNQYNTKYKYQQIGLPVRIGYRMNLKKLFALISGGVNMNLLVKNSIAPETSQVETVRFGLNDKESPFRNIQWAASTSIGVGYDVTEKMSILVAPEFTYSLTPMVREEQQQANTYQLGLSIGGRWRLTK